MAAKIIRLKLVIDKKTRKVLFAEASNDFVDLLFSILTLPIGIAVRLIPFDDIVGCLSNIYISVVNLDATYMTIDKSALVRPTPKSGATNYFLSLALAAQDDGDEDDDEQASDDDDCASPRETFYTCANDHPYLSIDAGTICPLCPDETEMKSVKNLIGDARPKASTVGGYVKRAVYMVTDDLAVTPMPTISNISHLQRFGERIGDLEEKEVTCGEEQGRDLLRASFQSQTVLTDVFLGKED